MGFSIKTNFKKGEITMSFIIEKLKISSDKKAVIDVAMTKTISDLFLITSLMTPEMVKYAELIESCRIDLSSIRTAIEEI
jgi:hypothetical protein